MEKRLEQTIQQMNVYTQEKIPYFFMFDFEMYKPVIIPLEALDDDILIDMPLFSNAIESSNDTLQLDYDAVNELQYFESFDFVKSQILLGNSYLTNLTFANKILNTDISLDQVFRSAKASYKLKYKDQFVVFSPEPFIAINDNKISTYPMKGTRVAQSIMDGKVLLDDRKEQEEHATIVDLMRNDLSIVANKVEVEDYRYIQIIKSAQGELFQTSSKITGKLRPEYSGQYGSVFHLLLPAGSVSGAPKKKTVEIIQHAESGDRGYYTGVFGIFDGVALQSSVMIRFIEKTESGDFYFRSGGGITSQSARKAEYNELLAKIYVPIH